MLHINPHSECVSDEVDGVINYSHRNSVDVINTIGNLVVADGNKDQPNPMHRNVQVSMKCEQRERERDRDTHTHCACVTGILVKYDFYMTEIEDTITISARATHCVVP